MITKAPRGVQDWYGDQMYIRSVIESKARDLASRYHIGEIMTPIFEHTQLFERGVGDTTDVVQKEMYTFEDRSGRSISLKPEGTAGVIRAFLEHGLYNEPAPYKFMYVTPAFRYEKPASGRLRQHHQIGVEFIGSASYMAEVEIISFAFDLIKSFGLKDISLRINSIGYGQCRQDYNHALLSFLEKHEDSLCPLCKERMGKNPLRVLDCKEQKCQEIVQNAPKTIDHLDEECHLHFESLKQSLEVLGIPYVVDSGIVRGLDYYTKTVFEFVNKDGFTLCGGGRYDKLIYEIDGKQDLPAIGFGMGIERIIQFMEKEGLDMPTPPTIDIYVGPLGEKAKLLSYQIVHQLRQEGFIVETDYMDRSLKAQMKYANKLNCRYSLILGENELAEGKAKLKNMAEKIEMEVELDSIGKYLQV